MYLLMSSGTFSSTPHRLWHRDVALNGENGGPRSITIGSCWRTSCLSSPFARGGIDDLDDWRSVSRDAHAARVRARELGLHARAERRSHDLRQFPSLRYRDPGLLGVW